MNHDHGRQVMALGAMVLLVVAGVLWGGLGPAPDRSPAWLQDVENGADHIAPADLAAEIMAGRPDFALVDVRPAEEYQAFHLPRARNLTVPQLAGAEGAAIFAADPRLVVLYSNGPAHPGQAWVALRQQGRRQVRVLDGGLDQFRTEVLTPVSLREGGSAEQAAAEAPLFALRAAFFLHARAASPMQNWATDPAELAQPTVVSAAWLQQHLPQVTVVDARERAADYAALHVAGAVHLPAVTLRERHLDRDMMLMPAAKLAERFGALGIANDTPVVIYAEDKMQDATLLALGFVRTGHRRLAILEGGILAWAASQGPLVADAPAPRPVHYQPVAGADDFTITVDALASAVEQLTRKVLDVRPADFFRGDKSTEARPGHIPGAVNRLFSRDLVRTADGHWWRPRAELLAEYQALGLSPQDPIAVSCRTGHTASESYFVLRWLLGFPDVKWFNGSWTEWAARQDLPAALGER